MQIEIFTLCDSAQVYAGKAVVAGAFNQVVAKQLPFSLNLTLAVRAAFEKNEGSDKTFIFDIRNPDGTCLIPQLKCEASQKIPVEKQGPLITYDLNIVLGNIVFKQYGIYSVVLTCENKDYILKFSVLQG